MAEQLIEAIQAIPENPTARPLNDEPTRIWLKEHGFDLSRWIAWWDVRDAEGVATARHFRQERREPKTIVGPKIVLGDSA